MMSDSETTDSQQPPHLFKPGQSGNPAGRPKGSRNKLGEHFIADLQAKWEAHGSEVIDKVIADRPHEFLKVVASILPKELKISNESDLTDEQIFERLRQLDAAIRPYIGSSGEAGAGDGAKPKARTH